MAITYLATPNPSFGELSEVAPNVFWLRSPMPFRLDHINLWLIREHNGWTVIDTGMNLKSSKKLWIEVIATRLDGLPIKNVICTHMHPDHLGLAGWLCQEYGATLYMSPGEFEAFSAIARSINNNDFKRDLEFFTRGGLSARQLASYDKFISIFKTYVSPINNGYQPLCDQQRLELGGNQWQVVIGRGHSPEHVSLWCEALNLFISGDQLLPTISSNISVHSDAPNADPLSLWIESYQQMSQLLKPDTMVLPAHGKPFKGANFRIDQQLDDIEANLVKLHQFCGEPRTVVDAFSVLFKRKIDDANLFMAFGESQAHFNCLVERGLITKVIDQATLVKYQAVVLTD